MLERCITSVGGKEGIITGVGGPYHSVGGKEDITSVGGQYHSVGGKEDITRVGGEYNSVGGKVNITSVGGDITSLTKRREISVLEYGNMVSVRRKKGHITSAGGKVCLLYTSPSPRDRTTSRMPSSA